jgi:predicted phage terminase large subunit-like protein
MATKAKSSTKRPAGFSRRASAFLAAAVASAFAPVMEPLFNFAPGALEARDAAREKLAAERAALTEDKLSFREFVSLVNPKYRWFKHCEVLGDVLQRVADGEIDRLMIFMPPRHGKSEETSRLFTAYFLYRYPNRWVGLASYAADLAYTLSRAAKDNFLASGGQIRWDAKGVKHWQTEQGGGLWAAGVGGPMTGKGWHLGIIDDPLKNAEQAASLKIREKQKEWFQSSFSTREEPEGGALIFILTRWNEDDLAGWQLASEMGLEADEAQRWHIINFPALAESEEEAPEFPASCTVEPDWRKPGEALCPERYNVKKLKRIAAQVGTYFWNALFQQRPRPLEGAFFKADWFKNIVGAIPEDCKLVRYWDKAGSAGKGDYTVGVLMARWLDEDGIATFFIVDVVRGQWEAIDREREIRKVAMRDESLYGEGRITIWMEQEGGSGGKESAQASVRRLEGYSVRTETVTGKGDKSLRADPFRTQASVGNIKLVKGDWIVPYLRELTAFPNGRNDDQVDATSGAFNKLALGRRWEWN